MFSKWGIEKVSNSGVLIVGEKGAFYSSDDYCGKYELKGVEKVDVEYEKAVNKGSNDLNNMYELFRALEARDPMICVSNFVHRARASDRNDPPGQLGRLGSRHWWSRRRNGRLGREG